MTRLGAREQQPGHRAYITAAELRAGIAHEADPRDQIRDYLLRGVARGTVQDRAGVVTTLQEAGLDVSRQGKNYVTAHDPESGKRWRLKGALYEHDFQRERVKRPDPATDRRPGPKLDEIDERKLQAYGERWDAIVNNKLPIIDAAMEQVNGRIVDKLRRAWLRPLVIGLSLFLGICGWSWGLLQWQSSRLQRLLETQETYRRGIAQEQRALDQLQAQTWGVWLHEDADATRYVVLPRGTLGETWPVTVLGQPAIRLSSE